MNLKKIDYFLLSLNILCIIGLILFLGHSCTPLVDIGRELYYPSQILNGNLLIKDLVLVFFPLSYELNAIFLKIFGVNINTFYFLGVISSLLFINALYLILRQFCSKILSFSFAIIPILTSICTANIMNFHLPYSWALVYGIVFLLWSIYFILIYYKTQKPKYFLIGCVLCGFAFAFKYEFILYGIIVSCLCFKEKKLKFLPLLFLPFFISYSVLFLRGLTISDIVVQFILVLNMSQNINLNLFYKAAGIKFTIPALDISILYLIKISILLGILLNTDKINKIPLKVVAYILFFVLYFIFYSAPKAYFHYFSYTSILLLILFVICYKKLSFCAKFVAISIISVLLKNFWGVFISGYGNFYAPLAVLGLIVVLSCVLKPVNQKKIAFFLILTSSFYFVYDLAFIHKMYPINSSKGKLYTYKKTAYNTNVLLNYIFKSTKKTDTIVVLPIGHTINFLSDRATSNYYNFFTPEYMSIFGEENITNYFKNNKPEYFVITNQDTSAYGYNQICSDYGLILCDFITKNYTQVPLEQVYASDIQGIHYVIYKLNDK